MNSVRDVISALESLVPPALAAQWDNVGLLIGDEAAACKRALLTIDLTLEVIEEARTREATFVIAYHPPIFHPVKSLRARDVGYEAARANLSVYSPHTALDAAVGGTGDCVAAALGLANVEKLPDTSVRIGSLPSAMTEAAFAARVKAGLNLSHVIMSAAAGHHMSRVVVCPGAGGSFVEAAAYAGADTLVAGELSHHDVLKARRLGLAVVCTFHTNTERLALAPLAKRLHALVPSVELLVSAADADPCRVV